MNSLEELNNYSNTTVTATDDRTTIVADFTGDLGTLAVNIDEGDTVVLNTIYGRYYNIQATEDSTANVITITIDLSNSIAAQVTWGSNTPAHVVTSTVGDVYTATNILSVDDYDKTMGYDNNSATIEFIDQDVNFSYTINSSHPDEFGNSVNHQRSYNVVVGTTTDEMSFNPTTSQQPYETQTVTMANGPQVVDTTTNPNATYTMVIEPSTSGVVDFQVSQNFAYSNVGAEGISIGPFTKSAINGYLIDVSMNASGVGTTDINFTLTNNLSGVVSNGTMTGLQVLALAALSNANVTRSYTENEVNYNIFATSPIQLRSDLDTILGYGTYLVVLNFTGSAPYGGKWREDGSSSVATLELQKSGTVAQLNSFLANDVNFIPDRDQFATHEARIYLYHGATEIVANRLDEQLFDITGTAQTGTLPDEGFYEYTTQGTLTITDDMKYFLHCDMYVVGAGGSANTGIYAAGGGGGGLTYTLDSDIVFENNITALEFIPGAANANNGQRGGDSFVKDYSGGFSGATLIHAPGGGGGAHVLNNNGIAGGNGGGGAANTGTGGGTVAVTTVATSLQGTTSGTSGQPFATYGWEHIDNAVGGNAVTNRAGDGGGTGINTDVRTFGTNELVGSGGDGYYSARPTPSAGFIATYNAQYGRGAWGNPTDSSLLTGRPGTIFFRFYQA